MAAVWPATGSGDGGGDSVADAAFAAARESFLAAPPVRGYVRPLRVDRDGGVAVLVFMWRADPRRFAIRVYLPTGPDVSGGGRVGMWGPPSASPGDWADHLYGWLVEELLTGAMRGAIRRAGDLVVVDPRNRGMGQVDRTYYVDGGRWGPVIFRGERLNEESLPPADSVTEAGFGTTEVVAAGRAGTLVSWPLVWVNSTSGGPLVGQAVCVADPAATGSPVSATLVALDVAGAHRGRGLEERLLGAVLGDAADAGITTLDGVRGQLPAGSGWSTDPTRVGRVHLDL